MNNPAPFGYCPHCHAKGLKREKRPNGNDTCQNGHVYKSYQAQSSQWTFTYTNDDNKEEKYVVKWEPIECVWIGDDDESYDTLDQIRTDMMHAGCKNITETFN